MHRTEAEIGLLASKNGPRISGAMYPLRHKPYMGLDLPSGTRQQQDCEKKTKAGIFVNNEGIKLNY